MIRSTFDASAAIFDDNGVYLYEVEKDVKHRLRWQEHKFYFPVSFHVTYILQYSSREMAS